jgi:hypothetical protein
MINENFAVVLVGGDFDGAGVLIPRGMDTDDFYVYTGDMINVYHHSDEQPGTADFLLDELAVDFAIPEDSYSVELIWNVDNQTWLQ